MKSALGWMAVGLVAFGLFVTVALARIDGVADDLARQRIVDDAERCVTSWETREDIRDAVDRGARVAGTAGAGALIDVATDAAPDEIAAYQQALNRRLDAGVNDARAEIPDPTCDREAAQQVLND